MGEATPRRTYDLLEEPKGEVYRGLIRASQSYGDRFLLVVNSSLGPDALARSFVDELEPYVLDQSQETEWPGTKLLGNDTALVSSFSLVPETVEILAKTVEGLFDWIEPGLPEDLCILRTDGRPWLVTISHEHDGYFELSGEEEETLTSEIPGLSLSEAPTDS